MALGKRGVLLNIWVRRFLVPSVCKYEVQGTAKGSPPKEFEVMGKLRGGGVEEEFNIASLFHRFSFF